MSRFTVLAQHMFSSQRIRKSLLAKNEAAVLKMVSCELHDASYYVVSIVRS